MSAEQTKSDVKGPIIPRATQAGIDAERAAWQQQVTDLTTRVQAAEGRADILEPENAGLHQHLERVERRIEEFSAQLQAAEDRERDEKELVATLNGQITVLKEHEQAAGLTATLDNQRVAALERAARAEQHVRTLTDQLVKLGERPRQLSKPEAAAPAGPQTARSKAGKRRIRGGPKARA